MRSSSFGGIALGILHLAGLLHRLCQEQGSASASPKLLNTRYSACCSDRYASVIGAPGAYTWLEDNAGRPLNLLIPNPQAPNDPLQWYCPEMPEWNMEKYRFYVDLPGDFWDQGVMLRYLRSREVQVLWDSESKQYVLPYEAFNKVFQVRCQPELTLPE